ncbi:hypothetical protein Fmac_023820 [Flemingia macrophylla]|uniref:Uncharacterized protein n=1 Tax=Flemingia macrophylla TaxID=520843 RepID=A0ABD1LML3_9FABA
MASPSESSLITKLHSSDTGGIHALVSDYLRPLADLKPSKKPTAHDQTLIRSLAKRFLSFLNASLSILPKRLPELSKSTDAVVSLHELLLVYRLCLRCLDAVSSQLASRPFSVEFQRLRFAHCLDRVLEKLRSPKRKDKLLPQIDKGDRDSEDLCRLVVEIVACLVRCAAAGLAKEDDHFRKVLQLVDEVTPWLGESEVRRIFSDARTCAPCIIFFDEVDALTTKRGIEGDWVIERLLNLVK